MKWNLWIILQFLESFHAKYIYINSIGNEEWIHSDTETIKSDYVLRTLKIL